MKKIASLFALVLASVVAAGCSANQASTLQAAADGSDPTVCRQIETTGTRFRERVCKTASTWAKIDAEAAENAGEIQDRYNRGAIATAPATGFGN
ncbi:MAG: hypothetical protein AAFQ22_05685 [Pseudomonadota bacterium]